MIDRKKEILIIYEFFSPAYKAGGIIRSLENLITSFRNEYNFSVITGGYDLGEKEALQGITLNVWTQQKFKDTPVKIWYDSKQNFSLNKWKGLLNDVNPDIVYINGFMHIQFLVYPLLALRTNKHVKVIIAPRGMLQRGAISVKPLKKFFYLFLIKITGLTNKVFWHFTSIQEAREANQLGWGKSNAVIIPNLSAKPSDTVKSLYKAVGDLQIVYASIITPKKNLHYLIQSLSLCKEFITLNIYGVIKEMDYWKSCEALISKIPHNIKITYRGIYNPGKVNDIISSHHAMALLSKAENYSHAIVESLSASRPVISSNFTSWDNLADYKAGWNISIDDEAKTAQAIDSIARMNNTEFADYYFGANALAKLHHDNTSHLTAYKSLFS